jgi:thiol-disulfide isomerase/thioredoxin
MPQIIFSLKRLTFSYVNLFWWTLIQFFYLNTVSYVQKIIKMHLLILIFFFFSSLAYSQNADLVTAKELQSYFKKNNDTTYVINFWATWCKPCIQELPYFLQLENELIDSSVKFLFVSLDDSKYRESRVIPFKVKNNMNTVFILEDDDPNEWIPLISEAWTGSIPATLIIKNNNETFLEKKLDYTQLKEAVEKTKGVQ